ncbi:MAG: DUF6516 family protein [Candidatus Binatia bacterium]
MTAELVLRQKLIDEEGNILEMTIWRVLKSPKTPEGVRYRLAYIPSGEREPAVLYDNHHPKGHHRHFKGGETPYEFIGVDQLIEDFKADVAKVREVKQ